MRFWRIAVAFVRREFLEDASYPLKVILSLVAVVINLGFLLVFTEFLGKTLTYKFGGMSGEYLPFLLLGLSFHTLLDTALRELSSRVRQAQNQGVLEALLATKAPMRCIMLALPLYPVMRSCIRIVIFLLLSAALLDVSLRWDNWPMAIAVLGMGIIVFGALGLIFAGLTVVFKRTEPLVNGFNAACFLLSGVIVPWEELPPLLQSVAAFLPLTPALEAFRYSLLDGSDWGLVGPAFLRMSLFAAVLVPLSVLVFRWSVRQAMRDGSLAQY
jgi:ABC-type polysaccharide/polyol phosphate export permease